MELKVSTLCVLVSSLQAANSVLHIGLICVCYTHCPDIFCTSLCKVYATDTGNVYTACSPLLRRLVDLLPTTLVLFRATYGYAYQMCFVPVCYCLWKFPQKRSGNLEGNAHGVDAKNLDSFDPKNVVTFVTQKLYCKSSLLHSSAQRSLHKLVHFLGLSDWLYSG